MEKKNFTRRDFVKTGALGATALVAGCKVNNAPISYEAKELPTTILGNTGVRIPRVALGCGSRYLAADPETAEKMLHYALDHGLYYWDTANNYVNKKTNETSEERLGKVVKTRRKEIFLATKVPARDPDELMRQLETSLKRLNTDRVDLLNMHAIRSVEEAKSLEPTVKALRKIKEQGITRFIGFSGHNTAEGMTYVAENYGLDFMLCALNHYQKGKESFEGKAVPAANKKGLGVMVMKVIRPRETVKSLMPAQLIRYALSLPKAHGAVISMNSIEVMKKNIALLKSFKPMTEAEMDSMAFALEPFYRSEQLDWMQPGYQDGVLT